MKLETQLLSCQVTKLHTTRRHRTETQSAATFGEATSYKESCLLCCDLCLVTDQVKLFICSPCLFWADNKVFICLSVPGWSDFNRPTFWMFWSGCDVTHISWRKHQQATSSTIYSTSCWIKEVVMRSPISFDTTRSSVDCQMWDVMSKRVNIESLKELFPAAGHFLVVLRVVQLAQKYDSQTVQHIHSNGQEIELMEWELTLLCKYPKE